MKKKFLSLFILFGISSVYASENFAVVDLQQLVSSSPQVKQLKANHNKKIAELDKILVNARGEIANEKDPAKVLMLEDKYMNEFNTKRKALEQEYSTKLSSIEKNIKQEISNKAKADNYDFVFAKSVVLYGGKDITSDIISKIK